MNAALLVDSFSWQSLLRFYVNLKSVAVAVADSSGEEASALIVDLSTEASALGLKIGMSVEQARARYPDVQIVPRQIQLEDSAIESLKQVALTFSPRFVVSRFGNQVSLCVDLSGLDKLMGDVEGIAQRLVSAISEIGFSSSAGIAPTQGLARLYALCGYFSSKKAPDSFWGTVLLADLPNLGRAFSSLSRFGIYSVLDLLALPVSCLAERIGLEALELCQLIRGQLPERPFSTQECVEEYRSEYECAQGVDDLVALGKLVEDLAIPLMKQIRRRGLFCAELILWLTYEGQGWEEGVSLSVKPAQPTRDVQLLVTLVALRLKKNAPAKKVEKITVKLIETAKLQRQLMLFGVDDSIQEAVGTTFLKLQEVCGIENVGVPSPSDSWADDSFSLDPFGAWGKKANTCQRSAFDWGVLRRFRPPVSCEVSWGRRGLEYLNSALTSGRIGGYRGPYRYVGQWWDTERQGHPDFGVRFDWYDICLKGQFLYRLRYDWTDSRWWIVGCFD